MRVRSISSNGSLPGVRTRFNARAFVLIAMSILLCGGIAGCQLLPEPGPAPGAFTLSSPEKGAFAVSLTITLNWTDAEDAESYTVEVDDEDTFSIPLVRRTGIGIETTSFVVPGGVFAGGITYYWRVIAINSEGSTNATNAPFFFTVSSNTSGALIPGFGTLDTWGFVTSNPSTDSEAPYGVAIDSNSTAMYVVGYDRTYGEWNDQWRIEKRNSLDGSLDTGFDTDGVVTSNPSAGNDYARGIAIDDTAMYVVGSEYITMAENRQWRIEKRSLTDGSLVPEFGAGGAVTGNPSGGDDDAYAIAIDSSAMYVVGYDYSPGNPQWRIEKRSLTDGSLVPGFGTGGAVTSNPSPFDDIPRAIAIDSTSMYVVGYAWGPGEIDWHWRIEKRSLTDGSLDTGFGTGGVVTSNPSGGDDHAYDIAIDSTAMYVVGYDRTYGEWNSQWRIEKRSLTDGSLVPGFGTGGAVTSDPNTVDDYACSIAIDSTSMYVAGSDYCFGCEFYEWRIEKRSLTDGTLVSEFGTDGFVTSNPSTGDDEAYDIAIDSSGMYVVGCDASPGNWEWRIEKRVK